MENLPSLPPLASGTQKVTVFRVKDGAPFVRWPVDAREMLRTGDYTIEDPSVQEDTSEEKEAGAKVAEPVDPVPHVAIAEAAAAAEHSPGVPLKPSGAAPDPEPKAKAKGKKPKE